jgi:hypothetical protein
MLLEECALVGRQLSDLAHAQCPTTPLIARDRPQIVIEVRGELFARLRTTSA